MTSKDEVDAFQMPTFVNPEDQGRVASFVQQALGRIANDETVRLRDIDAQRALLDESASREVRVASERAIAESVQQMIVSMQQMSPELAHRFSEMRSDGVGTISSDHTAMLGMLSDLGLSASDFPPMPTEARVAEWAHELWLEASDTSEPLSKSEALAKAQKDLMPQFAAARKHAVTLKMSKAIPDGSDEAAARAFLSGSQYGMVPHFHDEAIRMYLDPSSIHNKIKAKGAEGIIAPLLEQFRELEFEQGPLVRGPLGEYLGLRMSPGSRMISDSVIESQQLPFLDQAGAVLKTIPGAVQTDFENIKNIPGVLQQSPGVNSFLESILGQESSGNG